MGGKPTQSVLHRGEILGGGRVGRAGRTEVVRTIFGADRLESGEIWVNGQVERDPQPDLGRGRLGIAYLSEDGKH